MSISPMTYEVVESDGFVNVVVTKTGNFQGPIQGTLTTSTESAGGKIKAFHHTFRATNTDCIQIYTAK